MSNQFYIDVFSFTKPPENNMLSLTKYGVLNITFLIGPSGGAPLGCLALPQKSRAVLLAGHFLARRGGVSAPESAPGAPARGRAPQARHEHLFH